MEESKLEPEVKSTRYAPFVVLGLLALAIGFAFLMHRGHNGIEAKLAEISVEADTLHLEPGTYTGNATPSAAKLGVDPAALLIHVEKDGSIILLWKKDIRFKGNYEGYLYSSRAKLSALMTPDYYGRETFGIEKLDSVYPIIREKVNNQLYAVYFDLN